MIILCVLTFRYFGIFFKRNCKMNKLCLNTTTIHCEHNVKAGPVSCIKFRAGVPAFTSKPNSVTL